MKKINSLYTALLISALSITPLMAQGAVQNKSAQIEEVKELKLEDAILQAQKRSREIRMQQKQIDIAKVETEDAYYNYQNGNDYSFDVVSVDYSLKKVNEEYEEKSEAIVKEQIGFAVENIFDTILEQEEKYNLLQASIKLKNQKLRQAELKKDLGLASVNAIKTEKAALEVQKTELEATKQAIEAGYRKLNDKTGGKDTRYNLVKENIYEPLEMKRSLQGQISYSIDSNPIFKKQEESAKLQERLIIANTPNGAPTYTEYQKRKLAYEQGMSQVALSKDNQEQAMKERYESILSLEIQYDKAVLDLEEAERNLKILKKQYELGFATNVQLEEVELGTMQIQVQINGIIRKHNQLKTIFEKSYLAPAGI